MKLIAMRTFDGDTCVLACGSFGVRTMRIPIEFNNFISRFNYDSICSGEAINRNFPELTAEQHEFLLSGNKPEILNNKAIIH